MKNLVFCLCLATGADRLAVASEASDPLAPVREMLLREFPEFQLGSINPSPIADLYEVMLGSEVVYVSTDGRYIFQGSLFDMTRRENLTDAVRTTVRREILGKIPESEIIEFAPRETKYVFYVFTDIDCGYCRRLHNDIGQLNDRGIAVRYLAFPRGGINSKTYNNMASVWCAKDPHTALTMAKQGKVPKPATCDNPVAHHYELGKEAGVSGTPAIFTVQGKYLGGYLTPDEMLRKLEELDALQDS